MTLATVLGAGWAVGAATYAVVVVPGKRARDRLSRKWRERKAAVELPGTDQHDDVPEDFHVQSTMQDAAHPGPFE